MKQLNELDKPSDVHTSLGGTNEDIQEAFSQLMIAMLAAIIIVYLVLVLTFKGPCTIYDFIRTAIHGYWCRFGVNYNW